jgi:hypothetical protein
VDDGQDESRYPIEKIVAMAEAASSLKAKAIRRCLSKD